MSMKGLIMSIFVKCFTRLLAVVGLVVGLMASPVLFAANDNVEFDGLCVMGLAEGKRIKTDCSVNIVLDGKTYCFRTEDAKLEFSQNPQGNLARAKDHFAAGETEQTADDMGKYSVDDVKQWLDEYIRAQSKKNAGKFPFYDPPTGENLLLVYEKIDFMRTLHGFGFFPEVVFSHAQDQDKKYLIDFWVKPKDGALSLYDVRVYKAPKMNNGKWMLVKRQPKPWWWIPASEHPGESEQKRSWEVISAIEEHIMELRTKGAGLYQLKDDKTGEDIALDFVGVHQPVRKLKDGSGFFACSDFRKHGSKDEYYDIDFWLDEKTGQVKVNSVRVHKVPEVRDGEIIQVPRYQHDPSKTEVVP